MRNWLLSSTALYGPEGEGAAPAADTTPPAQSTPQETPAERLGVSKEVQDIINYDPFEPEPDSGQEGGEKKTASPPTPAGEKKKVGDAQIPPDGADAAPPKPDPVAIQLEEVAKLLRTQTEAAARPKAEEPKTRAPKFNLSIPESITKALLTSEEPTERAAALVEFANGLANLVFDETMKDVRGHLQEIVRRIPEISRGQVQELTTMQEMQRDFWDTVAGASVPEPQRLPKTKEMGQFVALTAQSLAMELKAKGQDLGWTPQFRDEVVKRVYAALGRPAPGSQLPQQQNGGRPAPQLQRQPKAPAFATGAGQRSDSQVQYKSDVERDIAEMFDS